MFSGLLKRECLGVLQRPQQVFNPLVFLFLAVTLFSIAQPAVRLPDDVQIDHAAVLWVIVLLTSILSLDSLFRRDFDNGVLEQMLIQSHTPFLVVFARMLVQWIYTGGLITLLSPVLGFLAGVPVDALPTLALVLLVGTPALSFLGAIGAALTVGFSRGGIILALLVLPLYIPVLIFGADAVAQNIEGAGASAQISWLFFITMLSLTIGPFAATSGLKISVQLQ